MEYLAYEVEVSVFDFHAFALTVTCERRLKLLQSTRSEAK